MNTSQKSTMVDILSDDVQFERKSKARRGRRVIEHKQNRKKLRAAKRSWE